MIHKFRIGESTEKQHVLPLGRAARQNSNSFGVMSALVLACPVIHAFLMKAQPRKAWMPATSGETPGGSESRAYLPPSPVEAPRTPNRNKIKAVNDGSKLAF
jgi:hypothetical protein